MLKKGVSWKDFGACFINACQAMWVTRFTLLKLSLCAIILQTLGIMSENSLVLSNGHFTKAILFIPAKLVEGWFLAVAIRLAILKEQWPYFLSGDQAEDVKALKKRKRAILTSAVGYLLMYLFFELLRSGIGIRFRDGLGVISNVLAPLYPERYENVLTWLYFGMLLSITLFAFALWGVIHTKLFRFIYLAVPLAIDVKLDRFRRATSTLWASFQISSIMWITGYLHRFLFLLIGPFVYNAEIAPAHWWGKTIFIFIGMGLQQYVTLLSFLTASYLIVRYIAKYERG